MSGITVSLLCAGCLAGPVDDLPRYGYLDQPAYSLDKIRRTPTAAYRPQPGDVLLYSDANLAWKTLYMIAGTGSPGHSGLVVEMPTGELGVLEAGYNDSLWIRVVPLAERLQQYKGNIWVRQRKTPITPAQTEQLSTFAHSIQGRNYSVLRLLGQLTPLRSRGPIRTFFVGQSHGIRKKYICSEAVLESLVLAGLLDPVTARPAATYPQDMFFDRSANIYIHRHPPLAADWAVPARWQREPAE